MRCPARTVLVYADADRDEIWVVTTRMVPAGEQVLLDYCMEDATDRVLGGCRQLSAIELRAP